MLRQNPFPGTGDSDQSFSEDEDIDIDSSGDRISLSRCEEKEGGLQILYQLEKLRDAGKANPATKCDLLVEKPTGIALLEDEVEMPSFGVEGGPICSVKRSPKSCSNEEMITDDEDNSLPSKFSISSNVNKAASKGKAKRKFSLGCYLQKNESSSCFTPKHEFLVPKMVCKISENSKHAEGTSARDSATNDISTEEDKQPKSPIDSHVEVPGHGYYERSMAELLGGLHEKLPTGLLRENKKRKKRGQRMRSVMKRNIATVDNVEVSKNGYSERSVAELLDALHKRLPTNNKCRKGQRMQSVMKRDVAIVEDVEVPQHGYPDRSMAELLDGLQERLPTRFLREKKCRKGGQRMPSVMKRDIAIVKDSEDESNSMDSDSRGEEEGNSQNLKVPLPERKRQTLLDCFQEILDASPWRDRDALAATPNPLGLGLFGRLKQVMQNEKERELEFMNNLQTSELPLCGSSCLHVLILSSYLDAKSIVCRCSLKKIPEGLLEQRSPESASLQRGERTVIFSSRTCTNVDLEVGKVICIYPPWKEVRVGGGAESILLCTCFSHVSV